MGSMPKYLGSIPPRVGPDRAAGTGRDDRGVCVGGLVLGSKASTSLKLDGV